MDQKRTNTIKLASVNGKIMPVDQATVPIEDRGYQFADAVYEYLATYNGRIFKVGAHMERLERSLAALRFPTVDLVAVKAQMLELLRQSGLERAGIYIQISRGVARRDHPFPEECTPQVVMTARPIKERPARLWEEGVAVVTVEDRRWGRCDIKSVQLLANVLAKQEALDAGAYDAVFVSPRGVVREASSSNLFVVRAGRVSTHPADRRILDGITRTVVLQLCGALGIAAAEERFSVDTLENADEAFLTGSGIEVLPAVSVNGRAVADGRPGAVTLKLLEALRKAAVA